MADLSLNDAEFLAGYQDGRDPDAPQPSGNRSACYRHSFAVRRAEMNGRPIPASVSRANAQAAELEDANHG